MNYLKNTFVLLLLTSLLGSPVQAFTFDLKPKEDSSAQVEIQNSLNLDAAGATLGIRQKPRGRFTLKVRVPKVKSKTVRVTVEIADEFKSHVKAPKRIITAKAGRSRLSFFLKVKRSVNTLIPKGSVIDIPVKLTDLSNGGEEEFILEVRD